MKIPTLVKAALGVAAVFTAAPALAAPVFVSGSLAAQTTPVEQVRWRGHHWHGHRHWGGHRYRYGWGPLAGGLAAGAIIGGAIASSQASADAVAYCSQRYKSYDPSSGTYLGYDGVRHPCP